MLLYLFVVGVTAFCLYLWEHRARCLAGALVGTDFAPWFGSLFNVQKHRHDFHDWMVHINENVKPGQSWTGGMPFRPRKKGNGQRKKHTHNLSLNQYP